MLSVSTKQALSRRIVLTRGFATATATQPIRTPGPRKEGNISDAFSSLSGGEPAPLPPRYASIKTQLIAGREQEVTASFKRLLRLLRAEVKTISSLGSAIIPEINFHDITNHSRVHAFEKGLRKRGVAVIRGVVSEEEALGWKQDIKEYIRQNPQTKAYPPNDPQVWELYWSPGQIKARAHPNMLAAQSFLMSFWNCSDEKALVSGRFPVAYADRLRMRRGGDKGFALGPHVDGGSVERWEPDGYGRTGVYDKVWQGKWEELDPWESSVRLDAVSDLYNGAGACTMFRMYQYVGLHVSFCPRSPGLNAVLQYFSRLEASSTRESLLTLFQGLAINVLYRSRRRNTSREPAPPNGHSLLLAPTFLLTQGN